MSAEVVLSIPAGDSYRLVQRHLVHACPASYRNFRRTRFVTFRQVGSLMERLYPLLAVLEVHHRDAAELAALPEEVGDRVRRYVEEGIRDIWPDFTPDGGKTRFYILGREDQEPLPHRPVMARPSVAWCYFRLQDLRNPDLRQLEVASRTGSASP